VPITANTALCGIVLHPAGHTRSPAMHNAAYAALALDAAYLAFDVGEEALPAALAGVRALGVRQLSVSIPHKVAVMEHLDEVEDTALRIGAVNTVIASAGRLVGSNTDWLGAVHALERETKLDGARAVVLGAGGTARAVTWGLLSRGARVWVLNRTTAKAHSLAEDLGAEAGGALGDLAGLTCDVLVNTTSVGLRSDESPVEPDWIAAETVVMDAVYDPERTRLLRDAQALGARTVPGRWMLIHQAVAQLAAWAGAAWTDETRERVTTVMARAFAAAEKSS